MSAPSREPTASASRDFVGWIVLAWVAACSAAYFQWAVVPRFPWLRDWAEWIF